MLKEYNIRCNSILEEDLVDIIDFLDGLYDRDFEKVISVVYKNYYITIEHDSKLITVVKN